MRTKRKPAKKRFLALFLCLSMVISMMNVGGNVWADEPENTVKADTNDTADIDKKINPIYTLQHYFWFPEVQMGQVGDPVSGDQMAIINTDGRGVPKDRNEAATMVVPLSLKQDDSGQMTVDTKPQLKKMFEDEEVHFLEKPRMIYMNRLYDSDSDIDDEENLEEHFNENYTLKEVWVHQPEYGAILEGITPEEEKNYFVVYESPTQVINGITRHDPAKFVFTNNPNHPDVVNQPERQPGGEPVEAGEGDDFRHTILIKEGTIIRLIFDTTKGTKTVGDNVKFFDYDITSGVIYKNWNDINVGPSYKTSTQDDKTTYFADAWRKGINHPNNYDHPQDTEEDRKYAKYAFGNSSTTVLTGWGDQVWTPEGSSVSKYINRANDDTDSIVKKASYGLVEGLHNDGTLRWSRYIDAPAVFGDAPLLGKTNYTNNQFKLVFNREGGTYTLSAVNYENGDIKRTTTDNLEYFVSRPTWDKKGILWSNDFWPMDIGKAENGSWGTDGHDLKFGREDLSGNRKFGEGEKAIFPISDDKVNDHNPYFGMTFNVDFVVDPGYVAPLRYFFFGDDDMWVFLSKIKTDENGNEVVDVNGRAVIDENATKLIADIGGVHQSIGEYVDLWDDGYVEQIPYRDAKGNPNKSVKYRLTFYYTERGASGSTCYMRFSLPFQSLVTKSPSYENELQIEKSVESMDPTSKDDLFAFQLNLYNKYGVELSNQYYYQRFKRSNDPNKSDTEIGTTHDNIMTTGTTFYLRDGEYIKVKNLPAGTTYHVKELNNGIGADGQPKEYSSTTFYTGTIQGGLEDIRIEGNEVSGRVDDESNIELPKINYVTYVNALNPGVLTLKKQMTGENIPVGQHHFKFNVTLTDSNDNPVQKVSWMKYLSDDNDRPDAPMEKQEDLENAEGKYVFELESKEKIMLYNLPVGTKYTITEESDDHFPLNKVEVNGSRVPSDNNTINGSIGDDPTRVEVVFTNTAEVSIEKSQAKVTDTGNEDFTTDILTVKKGDIIAYRLTVKNNSKVPINGLTVEDEIPYDNNGGNRLTLVQGSINEGGELQSDNKTILWEIPTLDPGKEVNLQFRVEVTEIGESQSWKNIAVLKEPGEPDEPSNPVYIVPKLEIKKDQSRNGGGRTTDTLGVNPGDEVTYYITVTNNSKGDAKDVTVTDEIPLSDKPEGDEKYRLENPVSIKGRILGTDKVFGGEREGDIIKWDLFDLAAGQTAELEFTVTVPDNGYHWKNIGYVSYTPDVKPDPNDPDAPKPEPTPPEPTNEVEIEKGIVIQKAQRLNDEDNFETNSLIVKEGSVITYQITVKNDRDTIVRDLVIEDEIPLDDTGSNRLTLVENSITAGGVLEGTVIKWKIPELAPQKEQKLEFKVKVEKIGESQSWKNIAILKEPDKPDKPSNPVYEVPNLEIRKDQSRNGENRTTDTLTVKAGDKVTYYITVSNNSKGDTKDVTVTDEIPLNILPETDRNHRLGPVEEGSIRGVVHETGQAFEGSQDGNVIKWDKFDLKAGQTATLRFTVSVPQGGYHWKNVGYVSYTPDIKPDPDDPNPQKPEPTKPEPTNEVEIEKPEISIRKTQYVGDDSNGETEKLLNVKPGDVITYCLTVNNGSDKDATDVIVTDRIPEGLTLVDGSISDGGTVGSDNVIAWKLGTLKAHESKKVRFKTVVPQVDKAAKWTNIAYVTSGDPDPDPEEDPKIPSNPVEAIPGIKIEKTQQVNGEGEPTKDLLHVKKDDKVTYYLTITNTSDATAFDVEVKDRVPEDNAGNQLELIGDSVQGGINHNVNGRDITWKLGDLKAGESQTVEFTVIVPAGGTYWINGASTSFVPPDPENPEKPGPEEDRTPDIPSNEVEIEKPDIRIRKTQYVGNNGDEATDKLLSVKPGDVITYRLTVTNGSDKNATDVIVTDQIPEGLTLVNGSVSDGGTVGSDDIITWKLGTLGGGESKTVQFKATVPQVDEAAIWRNIAYVTSGNPDPDPEEDPKTPSNPVEAVPGITIEKTQQRNGEGEPTKELLHVKKDDRVTYYLTITNTSETTAFDVDVKDTVPKDNAGNELILVEDSIRGGESHDLNGREIIWHLGDLASGASQVVEFTVIVPTEGSRWINGASTSYIPPDPEDPDKPGPEEDRTPDIPSNEVEIEKSEIKIRKTQYVGDNGDQATEGLLSVKPGDVITYRLTVTNESDGEATDVIVTDQIPEGLTLVNGSISDGGTVGSDDIITWKLGTLGGGESKTVQFKATVPQVDEAAIWRNIAYVTSGNPDPDPEEDPKTPSNPVEAVPGITIEKTQQRNGEGEPTKELLHVKKDDRVTYYLTITNTSETTAFDVDVKDTVPKDNAGNELILVEDSIRGGESHDLNGREIIWHLGDLASGASQVVEFTVIVPAEGTHWVNGASTSYIPPDPEDPDKPGPEEDRTPDIPSNEVEIEKSEIRIRKTQYVGDNGDQATEGLLSVKPGDVITYRLTVTNESDGEATDVIVTDQIPEGLTLVNGSISDGGTVGSDDVITWKLGTLGGGESKTVQFKAAVPQVDEAAIWRNIAYVTSGNPDPDPEEDPKTPSNPVEAVPGISIEKTQQVNGRGEPTKETLHVQKGDEVTYYLTVSNTSDAKAFDVIVTDEIPEDSAGNRLELIEDSIEGGESHAVSGRVITWNVGDLDVGESQTLSFTVRVPSDGSRWRNMATTSYVPGDPDDPEKPGPEGDRTPDIPSNEVEIEAGTTRIQLRARKVLNGADLVNGQFTFRIQGIQAEILEETDSETQSPETTQKPGEAGDTGENGGTTDATPSNAEREDGETGSSRGIVSGLIRPGGKTITSQVMLQAQTLTKVEGLRAGNHDVPMPSENTATNNEDGEIVFGEIEYSRPGTYTYKITEVKETRRGYTFDTTEYTVEVVVTRDDMTGELMARVNIVKPEGAEEILFTNRYRRPSSGGGNPSGGGGSNPQPGPGTDPSPDPTPENPDTPTPENPENPQPTPDTPALPDPNDPNSPPTVTIEENGVPRTYVKVWDPVNEEFIYIPEEDVPLFGLLPKTGEEERRRRLGVILVMSLAGIGTLMTMEEWRRRKREREIK